MNALHRSLTPAALALVLLAAAPLAGALQSGTSPAGVAYLSGGVGKEELKSFEAGRERFSFWLITASMPSGAWLADVKVRITEAASGKLVLEHTMDGPWLFVALPLGRYTVEALHQASGNGRIEVQRGTTTIHPNDHHQMVLHFWTTDLVGEDPERATPKR